VAQPATGVKWVDDCLIKAKHKDFQRVQAAFAWLRHKAQKDFLILLFDLKTFLFFAASTFCFSFPAPFIRASTSTLVNL